jgi:hypothetical protein
MSRYSDIKDKCTQEVSFGYAKGSYQRSLLNGEQTLSGARLRGTAQSYIARHREGARHLMSTTFDASRRFCISSTARSASRSLELQTRKQFFPIETARCRNIRGKLNFLMKIAALACLIVGASLAIAEGQSIFIQSPPVTSISTKSQASPSSSVDLNQAAMSQIINQLNQRQFQLSVTAAQARTSAQRSVFVPQKITIKRAK